MNKTFTLVFIAILLVISCTSFKPLKNADFIEESALRNEGTIRFMTYNILEGGKRSRDGIINVIKKAQPDVVFLQECNGWADDNNRILNQVADTLGMNGIIAPNHGGYKVGMLSRLPIRSCSWLGDDNPYAWNILYADLDLPDGRSLKVASTHYGWWGHSWWREPNVPEQIKAADYRLQTLILLHELEKHKDIPFVIGGDFNHGPDKSVYNEQPLYPQIIGKGYVDIYHHINRTYKNKKTCSKGVIDYIFATSGLADRFTRCEIVETPEAKLASDHLPVWADLKLP